MREAWGLLRKINAISPGRLRKVKIFVDFPLAKARRQAALDRPLTAAPPLRAADALAITEAEIQAEVVPPYSPELNPTENIWEFPRRNDLSNRIFASYEAIVDACCIAWNKLIAAPKRIRSIATRDYAKTVSA